MKKKIFLMSLFSLLIFTSVISASGQSEKIIYRYNTSTPVTYKDGTNTNVTVPTIYVPKKQELRGAWVATVSNIDIAKQSGTTTTAINNYKQQYTNILNTLESYNMNAVFFQVRPMNDAFYRSNLNPWSRYLIGTEGVDPGWDPLEWMVAETHKKNMEFHAWFNPYRVATTGLSANNFAKKNPEYVISSAGIFDPGIPQVQQFIIDTVMEVARNYDIDAIHFDDYFYPYGGIGNADATTYSKYNPKGLSLEDWRRENVNIVIRGIKEELNKYNQANNKAIQFGISPFGIWANKSSNPLGSNTNGSQSYSVQYADTRRWVKEGWIDYILPQIYWEFEKDVAPYADLVKWWADVVKGTNVNLYIGQAIYRYGTDGGWLDKEQIPNQILYNQKYPEVEGTVYFSYKHLVNSANSLLTYGRDVVKQYYKSNVVILPSHKNVYNNKPTAVNNLSILNQTNSFKLQWDKRSTDKYYVVYRFNASEVTDITNSSKVKAIVYPQSNNIVEYVDSTITKGTVYKYVVTAFDKANNEGEIKVISNDPKGLEPTFINAKDILYYPNNAKPNYLANIKAVDSNGVDLTNKIIVDDSNVNLNKIGEYDLIYKVLNNDIEFTTTVKVKVIDNLLPTITITGFRTINLNYGDTFNIDDYVTATDSFGNKINLIVENLDLNKLGTYDVKVIARISSSNENSIKLKITIEDFKGPEFLGYKDYNIKVNSAKPNWFEGVTAIDNYDGDVTNKIIVDDSTLDLSKKGTYNVTLLVTDSNNNFSKQEIKVVVYDDEENLNQNLSNKILIFGGVILVGYGVISLVNNTRKRNL